MTMDELKKRFPLDCEVQPTQEAIDKGFAKSMFPGYDRHRGFVRGYSQKLDVGSRPFLVLRIALQPYGRRKWCQPSLWEPVPPSPIGEACTGMYAIGEKKEGTP